MKKTAVLIYLAFLLVPAFNACKNKADDPHPHDNNHHHHTPNKAELTIASPTDNTKYNHGDTININVVAVGELTLHGWKITIRNTDDNSVLYTKDTHEHAKTLNISEKWVNDVHHHSDLELEVEVGLDHDGNNATKKVRFHCMP